MSTYFEESDRVEIERDESDERHAIIRTSKLPLALMGVTRTVFVDDWKVKFSNGMRTCIDHASKKKIIICTRFFIDAMTADLGTWFKYREIVLEKISKLNAMMKLDSEKGVCFADNWSKQQFHFANFIEIEVSRENDSFFVRLIKIPKDLINVDILVSVNDWTVKFTPKKFMGFDCDKKEITIDNDGAFNRKDFSESDWNRYHLEIAEVITSLNSIMTVDPEKGVRFGETGRWVSTKKAKFEFPDETKTFCMH